MCSNSWMSRLEKLDHSKTASRLHRPPPVLPLSGLGHLHICKRPAGDEDLETSQSIVDGNWSGRLVGGISGPSAELGDDPGCPSESVGGVVVLLKLGLALDSFVDGLKRIDLFGREDKLGRQLFTALRA